MLLAGSVIDLVTSVWAQKSSAVSWEKTAILSVCCLRCWSFRRALCVHLGFTCFCSTSVASPACDFCSCVSLLRWEWDWKCHIKQEVWSHLYISSYIYIWIDCILFSYFVHHCSLTNHWGLHRTDGFKFFFLLLFLALYCVIMLFPH